MQLYSLKQIFLTKVFPTNPFERSGSTAFFRAVKANEIDKVEKLLRICKFHVFDFDTVAIFKSLIQTYNIYKNTLVLIMYCIRFITHLNYIIIIQLTYQKHKIKFFHSIF